MSNRYTVSRLKPTRSLAGHFACARLLSLVSGYLRTRTLPTPIFCAPRPRAARSDPAVRFSSCTHNGLTFVLSRQGAIGIDNYFILWLDYLAFAAVTHLVVQHEIPILQLAKSAIAAKQNKKTITCISSSGGEPTFLRIVPTGIFERFPGSRSVGSAEDFTTTYDVALGISRNNLCATLNRSAKLHRARKTYLQPFQPKHIYANKKKKPRYCDMSLDGVEPPRVPSQLEFHPNLFRVVGPSSALPGDF
ncbi:hypothetical protein C8R43DRAFT_943512 [Mycena crocata]|nr:hypothetical protein C8R43DRAFT_943512 [Mycena crocata]